MPHLSHVLHIYPELVFHQNFERCMSLI